MDSKRLLEEYDKFSAEQREILVKKNSAYAIEEDALHNFKASSNMARISPEQGCLNQLCIKATRLGSLMSGGENHYESIDDTIRDLFNYAFLLHAIITENTGDKIVTEFGFTIPMPQNVAKIHSTASYVNGIPADSDFADSPIVETQDGLIYGRTPGGTITYLGRSK